MLPKRISSLSAVGGQLLHLLPSIALFPVWTRRAGEVGIGIEQPRLDPLSDVAQEFEEPGMVARGASGRKVEYLRGFIAHHNVQLEAAFRLRVRQPMGEGVRRKLDILGHLRRRG